MPKSYSYSYQTGMEWPEWFVGGSIVIYSYPGFFGYDCKCDSCNKFYENRTKDYPMEYLLIV